MKKISYYSDGSRFIADGMEIIPNQPRLLKEDDLTEVTDQEFGQIKSNPHDDKLIKKVLKRIDKESKKDLKLT